MNPHEQIPNTLSRVPVSRPRPRSLAFSLTLGLCAGFPLSTTAAQPLFGTTSTRLGVQPESMVTGDLNGDGKLDAVITGWTAQGLGEIAGSVYFGRGDGTFDQGPLIPDLRGQAALGDVTGDGHPDLVVARERFLRVHPGDGAGGFDAPITILDNTNTTILRPVLADFDGDGLLEIVVAVIADDENLAGVRVLGADGVGGFTTRQFVPGVRAIFDNFLSTSNFESLSVGDFNGDGRPDAAVITGAGDEITFMLSEATGALGSPTVLAVPTLSSDFGLNIRWENSASGDATGDGFDDIVLVSQLGLGILLLEGGPDGPTANLPATPLADPSVSTSFFGLALDTPSRIRLADLDGDGADEILLSTRSIGPVIQQINRPARSPGGMIEIWRQTDSGTLERQSRVYAGPRPLDFTAVHFNKRADLSLLSLADFQDTVGFFGNTINKGGVLNSALAAGEFRFLAPKPLIGYGRHRAMTFADTNRDGRPELLADQRNLDIIRLEHSEDSTFLDDDTLANPTVIVAEEPTHFAPLAPFSAGTMLYFRRQNQTVDEILTVGPAYGHEGGVSALIPDDPGIEPVVFRPGPAADAAFVDVTGVGGPDQIILHRSGVSTALEVSGIFSAATSPAFIPLETSPIGSGARLATCDIDGDGLRDIIVTDSQRAFVVRSLGGGLFAEPAALETGPARSLRSLDCADLNNDGFPEIIVGGFSQNPNASLFGSSVMVYMNDGAGAFATPIAVQARQFIRDLKAHDIDGDGARDLVLGTDDGFIDILKGDGLGGFTAANSININNTVLRIQIADFTEDGRPDIAVIGSLPLSSFGSQSPAASLEAIYLLESTPATAKRGDINADGVIDSKDLVMLLNAWGACAIGPCPGDINGDGVVNGVDLLSVLSLWD